MYTQSSSYFVDCSNRHISCPLHTSISRFSLVFLVSILTTMVRASNALVITLNCVFLLVGLGLIGGGVYYHIHADSTCQKFLENSLVILGSFVTLFSVLGLTGTWCKNNFLLALYLFLMILLVIGIAVFTGFVFVVTNEKAGKVVSKQGYKEYRLGDYSRWLQKHFVNGQNWDVFRSCLVDAQVCKAFTHQVDKDAADFFKKQFSPIESGCCKPPEECEFQFKNATYWTAAKESTEEVKNSDCKTWNNNQDKLCYNCNSCKAGFLANIRRQWRNLALFLLVLLIFMVLVLAIGCCARRNNLSLSGLRYSSS